MAKGRGGLGRGLGALIPSFASGTEMADIDRIVPNPHQPRTIFDPEALAELTESIRQHGILQPLLVTRIAAPDGQGTAYQLIAGERRFQAARQAGLTRVPVILKEAVGDEALALSLVENLQRADLTPLEEAVAYRRLIDMFSLTQEEIARRVGKSRVAVTNSLRLLSLSQEIRDSLARGEITEGHARAILTLADEEQRRYLWRLIVEQGLSVRQAEALARELKGEVIAARTRQRQQTDPDIQAIEEELRAALGTKVSLVRGRRGGHITIHFYSDEELEGLIGRLMSS